MSLSFTVIQRIAGGFGLMVVLLITLSFTGWSSKNTLSDSLAEVDTATNARGLSQRLQVALLEAGHYAEAFQSAEKMDKESEWRSGYEKADSRLKTLYAEAGKTTAGYAEFAQPLKEFQSAAELVRASAESLFKTHDADLEYEAGAGSCKPQRADLGRWRSRIFCPRLPTSQRAFPE